LVKLTQTIYEKRKLKLDTKTIHKKREFVLKQIEEFDPKVVKEDKVKYPILLSQKCKETLDNLLAQSKVVS